MSKRLAGVRPAAAGGPAAAAEGWRDMRDNPKTGFEDLRGFLDALQARGDLRRVRRAGESPPGNDRGVPAHAGTPGARPDVHPRARKRCCGPGQSVRHARAHRRCAGRVVHGRFRRVGSTVGIAQGAGTPPRCRRGLAKVAPGQEGAEHGPPDHPHGPCQENVLEETQWTWRTGPFRPAGRKTPDR